jgi:Sporulation protein Cse60
MTLKSKSFDGHRISVIEKELNEFLATIDENNFVDLKLVLTRMENSAPPEYYAAILIYKE